MKGKKILFTSVLFMVLTGFSIFTIPQAHAASPTKKYHAIVSVVPGSTSAHSQSSTKQYIPAIHMAPTANSDCARSIEVDDGFGITWNSWGTQSILNNVSFNVVNFCWVGIANGWWAVNVYATCPDGSGSVKTPASGNLGSISYGGDANLLTATLLMQCVTYFS